MTERRERGEGGQCGSLIREREREREREQRVMNVRGHNLIGEGQGQR
jgi:hypothetical protein